MKRKTTTAALRRSREDTPIFTDTTDLAVLAAEQGVMPVTEFDVLLGDFWPEEESVDEFIAAVHEWRREGERPGRIA